MMNITQWQFHVKLHKDALCGYEEILQNRWFEDIYLPFHKISK